MATATAPAPTSPNNAALVDEQRAMTSMRVFREFIKRTHNRDGPDTIDASGVISRECYDLWVSTRKQLPPNPEKAFQRSLSAHVTGVDGRVPFTPSEEAAVLKVLRKKERWPCFEQSSTRFGLMGFRAKGFHEKSSEMNGHPADNEMRKRFRSGDDSDFSDDEEQSSPRPVRVHDNRFSGMVSRPFFVTDPTALIQPNQPLMNLQPLQALHPMPQALAPLSAPALAPLAPAPAKMDDFSMSPSGQLLASSLVDTQGGFSFLETANMLLNRFYIAGVDAWSTVLSIARMTLVAKGWSTPPTLEDAQRLVAEYEMRYPGTNIIALDPTTRQLKDRILALSSAASSYLGPVARNQNGLDRRLIPLSDAWTALTTAVAAYRNPGVEFSSKLSILCQDGVLRPANCFFCVHSNERLLMLRAKEL